MRVRPFFGPQSSFLWINRNYLGIRRNCIERSRPVAARRVIIMPKGVIAVGAVVKIAVVFAFVKIDTRCLKRYWIFLAGQCICRPSPFRSKPSAVRGYPLATILEPLHWQAPRARGRRAGRLRRLRRAGGPPPRLGLHLRELRRPRRPQRRGRKLITGYG